MVINPLKSFLVEYFENRKRGWGSQHAYLACQLIPRFLFPLSTIPPLKNPGSRFPVHYIKCIFVAMSAKEKASKKGLRTSYVSTVIGISLVLFMIGLVLAGIMGLDSVQRQAKEDMQADLFFKTEWNDSDIKQVEQELKSWNGFAEVTYVSPERAMESFSGTDQNTEEILAIYDGESPMPPSITFHPKAAFATKSGMAKLKAKLLHAYPDMIEEVSYDEASLEDVNLGVKQFAFLFLVVAGLLIIVAVAMINNTIRLALYSRRFTIKTMQLVGATGGFIRRPFMWQAIFQGIVAGMIGMALLMTLFFALNNVLDVIQIEMSLMQLLLLFGAILVIGSTLTLISTWFALNKYLRTKLDDLY
jgi:cell division transport system permease protein